jgi:hypothetical protein
MKRVNRMNIFFALASSIIVYPILFVLPLRLKVKQKFILIIISLLISFIGILSKNLFPFWQALLIMVALAGVVSVLIGKRMPEEVVPVTIEKVNYVNIANSSINYDLLQEQSILEEEQFTRVETQAVEVGSDEYGKAMDDALIEELTFLEEVEPYVLGDFIEDNNDINNQTTLETIYEELHSNLYVAATIESDDEDLLRFEDLEEPENLEKSTESNIPVSSHYLSEIEKLLQEEENDRFIGEKEKLAPIVEVKHEPSKLKEIKLEKLS